MKPSKLKYRDLLINLITEKKVLGELFQKNNRYAQLLRELENYNVNDDEPLPLQKDLLNKLEMSRTQLMNLMQGLYQDFHKRLFNPNAYPVLDTEIWLFVKTKDDYWPIGIKNMESIPSKGESFTVELVGELWDGRYLKVESVTHEIENGVHRINIFVENPPLE